MIINGRPEFSVSHYVPEPIGSGEWAFRRSGFYPGMGDAAPGRRRRRRPGMGATEPAGAPPQLNRIETALKIAAGAAVLTALITLFSSRR